MTKKEWKMYNRKVKYNTRIFYEDGIKLKYTTDSHDGINFYYYKPDKFAIFNEDMKLGVYKIRGYGYES